LWQNGKAATNAGEATRLGEAAKFNRAFARTINFENRVRNFTTSPDLALRAFLSLGERIQVRTIIDIGFVSRVEEKDGVVIMRVLDPVRQLRTRCHCARRIVRKAKVNNVCVFARRFGNETILNRTRYVDKPFVTAIARGWTDAPRHYIGIDVNWINRIG